MSARQSNNLLPRQTPTPSPPTRQPRLRRRLSSVHPVPPSATTSKYARQVLADQSQVGSCFFSLSLYYSPPNPSIAVAENQCQFLSGNNIISCFPTNTTTIPQHEWATFVCTSFSLYMRSSLSQLFTGNSRLPQYQYTNLVDIYLFRADSGQQVLNRTNVTNTFGQAGAITAQVDDAWFGVDGAAWNGSNISYPFYWIISPNTEPLNGSQLPQSIFTAVRE